MNSHGHGTPANMNWRHSKSQMRHSQSIKKTPNVAEVMENPSHFICHFINLTALDWIFFPRAC